MADVMRTLLACSIAMSIVTLAYLSLIPLLSKRYSARGLYYVWFIILLGWLLPFRPNLELFALPERIIIPEITLFPAELFMTDPQQHLPAQETSRSLALHLGWIAPILWLIGIFVTLIRHSLQHLRFIKTIRRWGEDVADLNVLSIVNKVKTELKISHPVRIQIMPRISTPMLVGLRKPVILLPDHAIDSEELTFILKHELMHLKNKDLWYKALALLATALHWFNPVVYWMAKSIAVHGEIACDEQVLRGKGFEERRRYGETILGAVRKQTKLQSSLSTSFYGGKREMKNRIASIMSSKKKKSALLIASLVIIGILVASMVVAYNSPEGSKGQRELITNIHQNGQYVFESISWYSSKQEVMRQKQIDAHDAEADDTLTIESSFKLGKSSLPQRTIYRFSDDLFISGEYWFYTTDEYDFVLFSRELKSLLEASLAEPFANDLSILDQPSEISSQAQSVAWLGSDRSRLTVRLFTDVELHEQTMYLLQIKTNAPLPQQQSLLR